VVKVVPFGVPLRGPNTLPDDPADVRLGPSEAEALHNIKEFSPYRKENTTIHHYKELLVNYV
jgi:hypothetical protein